MLVFIALLVVVGVGSLSGQLVRNDKRSAQRHNEVIALLKSREDSDHVAEDTTTEKSDT
jgi:hypothetical protein